MDRGDPDEVVHLAVGDIQGLGIGVLVVVDLVHDVTDAVETRLVLDLTEGLIGGPDEDEVADGGLQTHGETDLLERHGHIGLELELLELFLETHQTGRVGIADPQGEP